MRGLGSSLLLSMLLVTLSGCGYDQLQNRDEQVKARWSELVNQYQRRADFFKNLVTAVKGQAAQGQQALIGVAEARANAGSIRGTPELLNDPQAFAKYQAAQGQMAESLRSLLALAEDYPQLQSDENFRDLRAQINGTENPIAVARKRYIDAVRDYNTHLRTFPTSLIARMFEFQPKPQLYLAD